MKKASNGFLEKAARALLDAGEAEFAASRAYYAMFYVAEALLFEKGLRFRKHGGVHGAFGEHFAKTRELDPKYHRWLLRAFDRRIAADYATDAQITADEAAEMIRQARDFLHEARRHLAEAP